MLFSLHRYAVLAVPTTLDIAAHPYQPGDWAYLKTLTEKPLQQKWKEPYEVLLIAVKVQGVDLWIYYSQIKPSPAPERTAEATGLTYLKLTRHYFC